MALEPLPLFVGDGTAADAGFFSSSLWSFHDDHHLHQQLQPPQQEMSVAELKQSLAAATLELEAARAELRSKDASIAKLADLVRHLAKDRDDLLLAATSCSVTAADSDCTSLVASSPVDHASFFDPVTSADTFNKPNSPTPAPAPSPPTAADAVLDLLAGKRPLPPKGRLLAAVMEAGPLLQNLIVAGQLPRWRNPPPVHAAADAFGARAGYAVPGGAHACTNRPVSVMPMASWSPGGVAKRVRMH